MPTLQPRRARFRGLILQMLWRETENGEAPGVCEREAE